METFPTFLRRAFILLILHLGQVHSKELPPVLKDFIDYRENFVINVTEYVTKLFTKREELVRNCNECSRHSCADDYLDFPCIQGLGTPEICTVEGRRVDYGSTIFRTPRGTDPTDLSLSIKENICIYRHLEDVVNKDPSALFGWTYVGTRDGHFRRHPATGRRRNEEGGYPEFNFCLPYDPRVRPWFVAASTGPKDIVLVVDKSGSMTETITGLPTGETKWQVTLRAVSDILATMTFVDFVNVVTFSDRASPLWTNTGLIRGTTENLDRLRELMDKEMPQGRTNFTAALTSAFSLLTNGCDKTPKSCSNCQKIILFLTDGEDSSGVEGRSIRPSEMTVVIDSLQDRLRAKTGKTASIFTYSMAAKKTQASDALPRMIACANDGSWAVIGPDTSALDALNSYYLYIAASRKTDRPIWTDPILDASFLGNVTVVAMPFYAPGTGQVPDTFLGVVGHDVPLKILETSGLSYEEVLDALVDRSETCSVSGDTACELQVYRNAQEDGQVCADPYPALDSDQNGLCYAFRDSYYKRSVEELAWSDAVQQCEENRGEIVAISDEDELAFVANVASPDGSWLGAMWTEETESFDWTNKVLGSFNESSPFWGYSEPLLKEAYSCVAIDTRGVSSNLHTKKCYEELSYICKYKSDKSCGKTVALPDSGYFRVPPLSACIGIVDAYNQALPLEISNNLNSSEIMCDLKNAGRTSEDVICCADSDSAEIKGASLLTFLVCLLMSLIWLV